jgi:DNA-directed RNA polymerase subunit L
MELNVLSKDKLEIKLNNSTGLVEFIIQDEGFTLMEPLIEILQNDKRLKFAGYKQTHCLVNEVIIRLKCKEESVASERECFFEALQELLRKLDNLEQSIIF